MIFTIITIAFNSEKTIERTIQSILSQTFTDFEYIIVDGASKDSTLDIVKEYEPLFSGRMKWISEPDKGIYNAMNKGIKMSNGDIIGIVNSDDWLEKNTLEILYDVLKQSPENKDKILTGEMIFHYSDGTTQHYPTSRERYESYSKRLRMGLNHPATFVPKKIYNTLGLFDEEFRLYADADFIARCYEAGVGVVFINKILSNMSDGGASNLHSKMMLKDALLKIRKHTKTVGMRWLLSAKCIIDWTIRGFIPSRFLKIYRHRKN